MAESPRGQRRASSRRGDRVRRGLGTTHVVVGSGRAPTAVSVCCASWSSASSCSSGAAPWRWRRPRTTSAVSRGSSRTASSTCLRTAARSSIATVGSWPWGRRVRPCTRRRTCLTIRSSAARDLCAALHITRKKERRAVTAALSDRESRFCYVVRKADPDLVKAALALKLPGVGVLRGGEAQLPDEGRGHPGDRRRRRRQRWAGGHRVAVRQANEWHRREPEGRSGSRRASVADRRTDRARAGRGCAPHYRCGHPVGLPSASYAHAARLAGKGRYGYRHGPAHR